MCTISRKLKLCSCETKNVFKLKHYWVLHKFVEGKDVMIMGTVVMPHYFEQVDHEMNEKTLLLLLNDGKIFDFEIQLSNRDRLEIAIKFDDEADHYHYGFEYMDGLWAKEEYDVFSWEWHHEEVASGKIKNALSRTHRE